MPGDRNDRALLLALLALNALIKFSWLGTNELALDEPFTVFQAQRSLPALFDMLRTENNPPLYFLVIKAWSAVAGLDTALLRIPSALFSALTVWPLWLIARKLGDRSISTVTCALFTLANYHTVFAHEVRAYSLFCLLAVTSVWLMVKSPRTLGAFIIPLAVVNTLMVYTHFLGWLMIGTQSLCLGTVRVLRPMRKGWLIATACTVIAFSPYAFIFIGRLGENAEHGTWLGSPSAEALYNMVWNWSNAPVMAVLFLGAITAMLATRKAGGPLPALALTWTFAPLLGMWLVSQRMPVFVDRYLVFASPGFALLAAVALCRLVERTGWRLVAPLAGVVGMAFTFTPWKDNDLHPSVAVAAVERFLQTRPDMPVLIAPSWYAHNYAWAIDHDLFRDPANFSVNLRKGLRYAMNDAHDLRAVLGADTDGAVLVDAWSAVTDPHRTLHETLHARFPKVDSVKVDRYVWVYRYTR